MGFIKFFDSPEEFGKTMFESTCICKKNFQIRFYQSIMIYLHGMDPFQIYNQSMKGILVLEFLGMF